MTESQRASLKHALAQKRKNTPLDKTIKDATPTIEDILRLHSCWFAHQGDTESANPLGIYAAPNTNLWYSVLWSRPTKMNYNPQDTCVSVYRVQGWSMPAANALKFEAIFRSDASKETRTVHYEIVRQPGGEWLLTHVSTL